MGKKKYAEWFETRGERCYNSVKTAQKGPNKVVSSGRAGGKNQGEITQSVTGLGRASGVYLCHITITIIGRRSNGCHAKRRAGAEPPSR